MSEEELEYLYGVAEETIYRKEETGFTVLDLSTEEGELITVVGVLPEISAGEELKLAGHWDTHATFGRQFRAELCERSMPETVAQMLKYLASGAVKGIGPSTANKIVEAFGEETFEVLSHHPEKLAEIKGISLAKAKAIGKNFQDQFAVREIMMSLSNMGLTPAESIRVYRFLGNSAVARIQQNPYLLCLADIGISFERADSLAASLPEAPDPGYRMSAGILHVLSHNVGNGHTCLPRDKVLAPAANLLGTNTDAIDIAIDTLADQHQLRCASLNGREFLFLPEFFDAEYNTAQRVKMLVRFPPAGRSALERDIKRIEQRNGIQYEAKQREAIITAIEKGVLILTGGPGTGKTTTVNGILELFEADELDVVLTAPTGRAAQRMSEITGKEAKTIHRLLEAERTGEERMRFARNARNPIEADAVIVDELSMVDTILFSALLDALPIGCRLVMVGDSDQLPPVGAGNVLHDLIQSELLPVVELNEVFRQAMESLIVTNAHRVVTGEMPELHRVDKDFFHMERNNGLQTAKDIVDLYCHRLPKAYGYNAVKDIEVLCPSRKGDTGTMNLNHLLQDAINPPAKGKGEWKLQNRVFREGDKVMQIKNDYNLLWTKGKEEGSGIFNGDIGILTKVDRVRGILTIDFDGRTAVYPPENLKNLELAYAVTVHKSQGSEFEAVIMPVIDIPPQLCYRNLFYTAVTRARTRMITIGREQQIAAMVANDKKIRRFSALSYFLEENNESLLP